MAAFCKAQPRSLVALTDSGICCPGRKRSLQRREVMESHTSFSRAHRRRRRLPLRPNTMESAVPQAPAPIIAMSDIDWRSLVFSGYGCNFLPAEFVFCAAEEPANIFMVLHNNENRYDNRGQQHWLRVPRGGLQQGIGKKRKTGGCQD